MKYFALFVLLVSFIISSNVIARVLGYDRYGNLVSIDRHGNIINITGHVGDHVGDYVVPTPLQDVLSETICNLEWLSRATSEDIQGLLPAYSIPLLNFLFALPIQKNLSRFVSSNEACDTETGNTPLHLAFYAKATPDVFITLIDNGAKLSYSNNDGITALELVTGDDRLIDIVR